MLRVRFFCLFFYSIKDANKVSNLRTTEIYLSSSGGLKSKIRVPTRSTESLPPGYRTSCCILSWEKGTSEFSVAPL